MSEITQADRELVHAMIRQMPLAAKMALNTSPASLYQLAAQHRVSARERALDMAERACVAAQYSPHPYTDIKHAIRKLRNPNVTPTTANTNLGEQG